MKQVTIGVSELKSGCLAYGCWRIAGSPGPDSGMPLKYNDDGSLDVYIQAKSPGADKESNWLPSPPSDPFNLTVRVYQPKPGLLDGSYKLPPVTRVQ